MVSGRKTPSCDEEVVSSVENGTSTTTVSEVMKKSSSSSLSPGSALLRKADVAHVGLRVLCMASSVAALSSMVTARQASTVTIYGFHLPVYSNWSFSPSFQYVVGVTAAVVFHSFVQLLITASRLLKKLPMIPSRNHAWLSFAGDQVFAYAMMSAGSAASGVSNLNRTGIRHTPLPNFCKPLNIFCDHIAISIVFTFLSCLLLATSAVQNVIWLSNN